MARDYVTWSIPGCYALIQFDCTKRWLQSIDRAQISTYIQVTMTLLHIGWCYLFIVHLNLKVFGAAIALNTTYLSCYLCQEIYVRFLSNAVDKIYFEERTAPFFSQVTLQEWMEFLKYGVPGTCM